MNNSTRVGVFFDGSYYLKMSNFFKKRHPKQSHFDISKFNEFIEQSIADQLKIDVRGCSIVGGHFFRGRITNPTPEQAAFDRMIDDHLYNAGISSKYIPIRGNKEKGVDVELALTALEESMLKMYDIIALIAGDEDFVPLVRKLSKHGVSTALYSFNTPEDEDDEEYTKTSWLLSQSVFVDFDMNYELDNRRKNQPEIFTEASYRQQKEYVAEPQPTPKTPIVDTRQTPQPKPVSTSPLVRIKDPIAPGYIRANVQRIAGDYGFIEHPDGGEKIVYMNSTSFRLPSDYYYVQAGDMLEFRISTKQDINKGVLYNARDVRRVVE